MSDNKEYIPLFHQVKKKIAVKVNNPKGKDNTNAAILNVNEDVIFISLFRHSLYEPNKEEFWPLKNDAKLTESTINGLDPRMVDVNKKYYAAPLRSGWVYICNETDNLWHEFESIADFGLLQEYVLEKKDNRKEKIGYNSNLLKVNTTNSEGEYITYWFAFSKEQWTYDYWQMVFSDKKKREDRMQKFECNKYLNKRAQPSIFHKNEINAYCEKEIDSNYISDLYLYKQDYDTNFDISYVCLHDPISAAYDLAENLADARLKFECLIKSMQIGVSDKEIYNALKNQTHIPLNPNSDQLFALHMLTLHLYPLLFDAKNKDTYKYKKHIDTKKFEAILGFSLREAMKGGGVDHTSNKKIVGIEERRNTLIDFLASEYFINLLNDYIDNSDTKRLNYLTDCHTIHNVLAIPPSVYDYHLDIHNTAQRIEKNEKVNKYFSKVTEQGSWLDKIAVKDIWYENLIDQDTGNTANTLAQNWLALLDAYPAFLYDVVDGKNVPKKYNCTVKWMENVKILGKKNSPPVWEFHGNKFRSSLVERGFDFDDSILKQGRSNETATMPRPEADRTRNPKVIVELSKKHRVWTEKFLKNGYFKATYRSLGVFNLALILSFENGKGSYYRKALIGASSIELMALLTRALMEYEGQKKAILQLSGAVQSKSVIKFSSAFRYFGTSVATGIVGLLMFYDVVYYAKRGDTSAAVISGFGAGITLSLATLGLVTSMQTGLTAMGLANTAAGARAIAISANILKILSVSGTSTAANAWRTVLRMGSKAWVLFILSVLIIVLLYIFQKSELEKFIINCILGDNKKLPQGMQKKRPAEVMQYLYANRNSMIRDTYKEYRDFTVALETFEELLPPYGMFVVREEDHQYGFSKEPAYMGKYYRGNFYIVFYHFLPESSWSVDFGVIFTNHDDKTYDLKCLSYNRNDLVRWQSRHIQGSAVEKFETKTINSNIYLPTDTNIPKAIKKIMEELRKGEITAFAIELDYFEFIKRMGFNWNETVFLYSRLRYGNITNEEGAYVKDTDETTFWPKDNMYNVARIPIRYASPGLFSSKLGIKRVYYDGNFSSIKYYKDVKPEIEKLIIK